MKLVAIACVHVGGDDGVKVVQPGQVFTVADDEALRLIELNAAKASDAPIIEDAPEDAIIDEGDDIPVEEMNREQLIAIAEQLGLTVAKNAKTEKIREAVIAEVNADKKEAEIDEESDTADDDI